MSPLLRIPAFLKTWYGQQYPSEARNMTDFRMRPGPAYCPTQDNCFMATPGKGHRFYSGSPDWQFGDGLSFTRWQVGLELVAAPTFAATGFGPGAALSRAAVHRAHLAAEATPHTAAVVLRARLTVTNAGGRDGDYVGLLFARPPGAGVAGTPRQVLIDFARIRIARGNHAEVGFQVRASALALASKLGRWEVSAGSWTFFVREQSEPEIAALLRVV